MSAPPRRPQPKPATNRPSSGRPPANRTSAGRSPATRPPAGRSRSSIITVSIVVAVVVIAAVIAVIVSSGSDETATPGLEQTQPVTVAGTALPELPDSGADPAIGMVAPTLTGSSFDGTPVVVAPGKPTLVVFLAHWCSHCRREVPLLVSWEAAGGVPAGVQVFGVATSTSASQPNYPPSSWLANEKFPWPVLTDDTSFSAAAAYGLPGFPYFVLLDAEGVVKLRLSGEIPTDDLAAAITGALAA